MTQPGAVAWAYQAERLRTIRRLNWIRVGGTVAWLAPFVLFGRILGWNKWMGSDPFIAVYAVLAAAVAFAASRNDRIAGLSAFMLPFVDIPATALGTWFLVRAGQPIDGAVGFNLGLVCAAVSASALLMWPRLTALSGAVAFSIEGLLELANGADPPALILSFITIGIVVAVSAFLAQRLAIQTESAVEPLVHLRRTQESLARLIEATPDGMFVTRGDSIAFANKAAAVWLGYGSPLDLIGLNAEQLVHPEDRETVRDRWRRVNTGQRPESCEVRYLRKDHSSVLGEVTGVAVEFKDAPAFMVVIRDLTERRALQAQLMTSDRMASMGTLAAGVAHEINNPLAIVMANLEMLQSSLPAAPETGDGDAPGAMLTDALEASARVRDIVRDLRIFSRAEDEVRGPVDLTAVVESTIRMAGNEIRHRARLVKDIQPCPNVYGNAGRLGQVVLNILMNAVQAIPEGHSDRNEIRVASETRADGKAVITIRDTGSGMPPEIVRRIFDAFFTTKPPGIGTGLGLSMCHRIVASMGGIIEVESAAGEGTEFRVILPQSEEAAAASGRPAAQHVPLPKARVLVVDDEPKLLAFVSRLLGPESTVITYTDPIRALMDIAHGEPFDAILCDIRMPRMTGIEFFQTVQNASPESARRIVFMTGGGNGTEFQEFLDGSPNPCLDKPFDASALRRVMAECIARGFGPALIRA